MATIVTVDQAVQHLRLPMPLGQVPPDPMELELSAKLDAAEAIILDYLEYPDQALWSDLQKTLVSACILLELAELWRFRGDDPEGQGSDQDPERGQLSPTITNLLRRMRTPALA